MQSMAFRDDYLRLLISGNPMRLSRTVRRLPSHHRPYDARAQPASMGKP